MNWHSNHYTYLEARHGVLKMDTVVDQVRKLAAAADEAGRKKLLDSLRDLSYAIETPYDTLQRFAGLVSQIIQRGSSTQGEQC